MSSEFVQPRIASLAHVIGDAAFAPSALLAVDVRMIHSAGRRSTWREDYGAGGICPDTETLPVLRRSASDCAVRHIRGSMCRLRRNGASCAQHGACGCAMEQEEGGRFLVAGSSGPCQLYVTVRSTGSPTIP